jgi:putative sterol carrier protein
VRLQRVLERSLQVCAVAQMEIPNSQSRPLANVYCLVTLALSDEDFGKLVSGKANAQRLFMSGKLKVKGDVMKAVKLDPILKKAQTVQAKL